MDTMHAPDVLKVESWRQRAWTAERRAAQLQADLATERERWLRLKAAVMDADRMKHLLDTLSAMRGLEQQYPSQEQK